MRSKMLWLLLVLFGPVGLVAQTGNKATFDVFGSDLTNEGNPRTGWNISIQTVPAWQTPPPGTSWVSFANTGAGGFSPPNTSQVPEQPTASFWEVLYVHQPDGRNGRHRGEHQGFLTVWADDTAQVRLVNSKYPQGGIVLSSAKTRGDDYCVKGKIGCEPKEGKRINLTPHLTHGWNILWFDVYQLWGDGFGLMYQGEYKSGALR